MLEITNLTKRKINEELINRLARGFYANTHVHDSEISLVFIGDKKSQEINKKYRKSSKITDVLSFPNYSFDFEDDMFLGEVFVNLSEVSRLKKYDKLFLELEELSSRKSKVFLRTVKSEPSSKEKMKDYLLVFIILHGILHLIGFKDEEKREREVMIELGFNMIEKIFHNKEKML